MDFSFTPEQQALQETVRAFLERHCTSSVVRAAMDGDGHDASLWDRVRGELGLAGLAVPESHAGLGGGTVELAVALQECGRSLLPAPLLSTTTATLSLLPPAQAPDDLVGAVASGELVATLAVAEAGRWDVGRVRCRAEPADGGWAVSGAKEHVLDGGLADLFLVVAATPDGPGLFAVRADSEGVRRTPLTTLDLTRRQATLELTVAPAHCVALGAEPAERAVDLVRMALAVESVGVARRCLDLAVDHLRTRVQFGRPIGSFQALQHRAADLLVAVESATSTAYYAAWAAAAAPEELALVAPLAKAHCTTVALQVAGEAIQMHGGMGFTWDHDLHLLFKRAKSSERLFGDPATLRRLAATRAGALPAARPFSK